MKPQNTEITDIFLMTMEEMTALRFHDTTQVPDYDALFGQEPTDEARQTAAWDREMAALLTWKPYMHNPQDAPPDGANEAADPDRLGQRGRHCPHGMR